tara:strand:+ start:1504 stop:2361 length:858 start_codon:yes stop_codon:yes gene_type:complete
MEESNCYQISNINQLDFFQGCSDDIKGVIVNLGIIVYKDIQENKFVYDNTTQLQTLKDTYESKTNLLEQINTEKSERLKELSESNERLFEEVQCLKNKYQCTNTKKGQDGEKMIEGYIEEHFVDCEILNTAKKSACGDLNMIYQNTKILVESKNKYHITKDDISKFKRDIDETNSDTGIFVCTQDINIPLKGKMNFEIIDRKPLLYMTDFENHPELFKLCMQIAVKISNKIKTKPDETIRQLDGIVTMINTMLPILKDCISSQTKTLSNLKSLYGTLQDKLNEIS